MPAAPDSQIPAGGNRLAEIELEGKDIGSVHVLVPLLGDLRNLTALKTLGVTLRARVPREGTFGDGEWERVDALLEPLLAGVRVNLCAAFDAQAEQMEARDVDAVRSHLPVLSSRGILHVYQKSRSRE